MSPVELRSDELRAIRRRLRLTQQELARRVGTDRRTIMRLELGRGRYLPALADAIAALSCTTDAGAQ